MGRTCRKRSLSGARRAGRRQKAVTPCVAAGGGGGQVSMAGWGVRMCGGIRGRLVGEFLQMQVEVKDDTLLKLL